MKPKTSNIDEQASAEAEALARSLIPMLNQIKALQEQTSSLGIFPNHRDLASCESCLLFEDIRTSGDLFVYRREDYKIDTGLLFIELEENAVQCPQCGNLFCPYDAELAN